MSTSKKISVSIPVECVNELDMLSRHLGITRSALLSGLLELSLPKLSVRVALSESADDGVPKRYTSSSKATLDRYLASLFNGAQYDLFDRR